MGQLITVDGFYRDPMTVRHLALQRAKYQARERLPHGYAGTESIQGYYSENLVQKMANIIGQEIEVDERQFAFGVFAKKMAHDEPQKAIHVDRSAWTAIVYLSPNPESNSGTAIYRHLPTGDEHYNPNHQSHYKVDALHASAWQMTVEVGNVFNRLVVFESGKMFHAGLRYFGDNDQNCRLSQIFFFNTRGKK